MRVAGVIRPIVRIDQARRIPLSGSACTGAERREPRLRARRERRDGEDVTAKLAHANRRVYEVTEDVPERRLLLDDAGEVVDLLDAIEEEAEPAAQHVPPFAVDVPSNPDARR